MEIIWNNFVHYEPKRVEFEFVYENVAYVQLVIKNPVLVGKLTIAKEYCLIWTWFSIVHFGTE